MKLGIYKGQMQTYQQNVPIYLRIFEDLLCQWCPDRQISSFKGDRFCMTARIAISGKSSTGPEQLKKEGTEDTGLQATLKNYARRVSRTWTPNGKHPKPKISTNAVSLLQYDNEKCHTVPCYYIMIVPWRENSTRPTHAPEVMEQVFKLKVWGNMNTVVKYSVSGCGRQGIYKEKKDG